MLQHALAGNHPAAFNAWKLRDLDRFAIQLRPAAQIGLIGFPQVGRLDEADPRLARFLNAQADAPKGLVPHKGARAIDRINHPGPLR